MSKRHIVLGLNAFHADSAAALVIDGVVVAAAEEERFRRIKHWAGFPSQAITWCLRAADINLGDLNVIAVNTDPVAARADRIQYALTRWPSPKLILDRLSARNKRLSILDHLEKNFQQHQFAGKIVPVEHHLAHLASAFYPSGFEKAAVLSIDGMGDFASSAWGLGDGSNIDLKGRVKFPHSLGVFYQAITQYLGFAHYGDEYKVMGLAPYGEPVYLDQLRQLVRIKNDGDYKLNLAFFRHHRERIAFDWDDGVPVFADLFNNELEKLLGPRRLPEQELTQKHKDIARSAQQVYEEALFALLRKIHRDSGSNSICLAGGCAQNSAANGKIGLQTPFDKVYIAAAGYDAGGATGAALWVAAEAGKKPAPHGAYLGPSANAEQIQEVLQKRASEMLQAQCEIENYQDHFDQLCDVVCQAIEAGEVIGWYQGAMEWGPRALGNRSILADPRRSDIKEILNLKIKRRESFRPFAPSVLREAVSGWFEQDGEVPYMGQVFQIRAEKRELIPAVAHVDGSGRLQSVSHTDNPRYHALISRFYARTQVPMLLNTSFNENEPIVCFPEQALDCFLRTKMDVLVLNDVIIRRTK